MRAIGPLREGVKDGCQGFNGLRERRPVHCIEGILEVQPEKVGESLWQGTSEGSVDEAKNSFKLHPLSGRRIE